MACAPWAHTTGSAHRRKADGPNLVWVRAVSEWVASFNDYSLFDRAVG